MQTDRILICVAAPPGRLRDSLRVMLRMNTAVTLVGEADTALAGLDMARELHPDFILIDDSLPEEEAWHLLAQTQRITPPINCCVFVHSYTEEIRARSAAADIVLQAGFSTDAFWKAIRLRCMGK
jgi:DNA-binding NarL/FixJ family response regulator